MQEKMVNEVIQRYSESFHPVVPFEKEDRLLQLDFTATNNDLTDDILNDTGRFTEYVNAKLAKHGARYGIGGYNEHRTIYSRSTVFDGAARILNKEGMETPDLPAKNKSGNSNPSARQGAEPRRLHLGIDIWGKPYTKVLAPLDGIVHSFAFNNAHGDYGATIILTHNLDGVTFHTLYGHLSLNSIKNMQEGDVVRKGDVFCEFGIPFENGQWPPHLHFQIIVDLQGMKGDYPGVCRFSEREKYLANCPDPDSILHMMAYATQ